MSSGLRLVLLGAPGSGKGTLGQRLSRRFDVPHVATGDIIRDQIARGTEFGHKVEAAIAAGNFAPDADIIYWVRYRLNEPDASHGYILDGFPRNLAQAEALDAKSAGGPLNAVLELRIDEQILVDRLAGRWICPLCDTSYQIIHNPPRVAGICDLDGTKLVRRPDDEPEAVRHRLKVYEEVTLPLHDYYRRKGLLCTIDGGLEPALVEQDSVLALEKMRKSDFEV